MSCSLFRRAKFYILSCAMEERKALLISDFNCILVRSYSSFILELNRTWDQRTVIELDFLHMAEDSVSYDSGIL